MKRTLVVVAAAGLMLGLEPAVCPHASIARAAAPDPGAHAPTAEDRLLLDLLAQDTEAQKQQDPLEASSLGDRRFDRLWPDLTTEARQAFLAASNERLQAAEAIDESRLSPANRINRRMFLYELRLRNEAERFKLWQFAVTTLSGPHRMLPQVPDNLSFTTDAQLEDYLARLEAVPAYLDQVIALLRQGLGEGRTPARVVMGASAEQALSHGGAKFVSDPGAHAMFRPFVGRNPALNERAKRAIAERVAPAFERLGVFLRDEYVPGCRTTIAASDLPDGQALYAFQIKRMTTTDLTAQQIHDIGVREVARIRAEMMDVIARSDFPRKSELSGDELFRAFVQYLRSEPRFYFTDPEDLLAGYREICKRIDAEMPALFGTLPRLPYGVREMPRFIAPSSPTAYYYRGSLENGVPGFFIANTFKLDQRPKYEMIALSLHEAVPGHHHQVALAQELKHAGLPEWRTMVDYTVLVEGWGLYSERLGLEMGDDKRSASNPAGKGLYTDPYDDFGRLSYEMWRAMRLVVDTGMHALGWPRQRAIDFMLANSALSPTNIEREVDRYISWPAQALAYKIGELKIRDLRAWAEGELGEQFDVRGFHDAVLLQGAVPLELLERQVREWVESRRAGG